ncbi:hypothetical protein [Glutamicibacter soli]
MATTAQVFNIPARGYSHNPTQDVEILPDLHECQTCHSEITFNPDAPYSEAWTHATAPDTEHQPTIATRCIYCHSHHVTIELHAYHDAITCTRCGGIHGIALGD